MAGKIIGGFAVPEQDAEKFERAVIGKYTLVPVVAVFAAIGMTAAFMMWTDKDSDRILVLETKMAVMEQKDVEHKDKLDTIETSVRSIHDDLLIIKTHLGVGEKPSLGRQSNAE